MHSIAAPWMIKQHMVSRAARSSLCEVRADADSDWDMIDLQKLLLYLCANASSFQELLIATMRENDGLKLILYCDGVTPGSVLTSDNKRKSLVWYASFLEFGDKLCHEELWFTVASARTSWVRKFPAGTSGLTRRILRDMFIRQDVSGKGIAIEGVASKVVFHGLLADEEALNAMLYIKGASGTVPCAVLCSVVSKPVASDRQAGLKSLAQRSPLIVDITCTDVKRCGCKSDEDVWTICDEVAASFGTPAHKLKQQTKGMSYHSDALLFDIEMRSHFKPASSVRVDPMHIVYSNGVLSSELMLFMRAMKEQHGFYFAALREYLEHWRFSSQFTHQAPKDMFNEHRENSSKDFIKLGASEIMAIYPAVRAFVTEALSKSTRLGNEMDSLMKLFAICDLLKDAMHGNIPAEDIADSLEVAVPSYLDAFKRAYGPDAVRFKHHQLLHIASQVRRDKRLLTCWALERKHTSTKQCFAHYRHAEIMPAGALARMVNAQVCIYVRKCTQRCRPLVDAPDIPNIS